MANGIERAHGHRKKEFNHARVNISAVQEPRKKKASSVVHRL